MAFTILIALAFKLSAVYCATEFSLGTEQGVLARIDLINCMKIALNLSNPAPTKHELKAAYEFVKFLNSSISNEYLDAFYADSVIYSANRFQQFLNGILFRGNCDLPIWEATEILSQMIKKKSNFDEIETLRKVVKLPCVVFGDTCSFRTSNLQQTKSKSPINHTVEPKLHDELRKTSTLDETVTSVGAQSLLPERTKTTSENDSIMDTAPTEFIEINTLEEIVTEIVNKNLKSIGQTDNITKPDFDYHENGLVIPIAMEKLSISKLRARTLRRSGKLGESQNSEIQIDYIQMFENPQLVLLGPLLGSVKRRFYNEPPPPTNNRLPSRKHLVRGKILN